MSKSGEPFFFVMALLLIAIVIAGFGGLALQRPDGPFAMPLLLHLHGTVFLSWYILLATQAGLIGAGRADLHKRLGKASLVLAIAMIVLGYLATRHAYARPDWSIAGLSREGSAIFPATDIVLFVIAYLFGLANRRVAAAHKRLMLVAWMIIIDAAMARLMFVIGAPFPVIIAAELALVLALVAYDFVRLKRPHWASLFGVALMAASIAAKGVAPTLPWWPSVADTLFG